MLIPRVPGYKYMQANSGSLSHDISSVFFLLHTCTVTKTHVEVLLHTHVYANKLCTICKGARFLQVPLSNLFRHIQWDTLLHCSV